ncbi:VOC family protein [Dysgonomonas capnocytophagoides]|uniref:VOC family protein n=1 Tax=Dysgonomonas capnocytophagoides TaxID=45254 RepID=UPI00333EB817
MKLKIHLVFPGTCKEALTFYSTTLNGKIDFVFHKKDEKGAIVADADKDRISHMVIKTPHFELAGEDANSDQEVIAGNNNKLVLVFQEVSECKRVFDIFAQNGTVTMPFEKTFFCDGIGEITDKYGIPWLIMVTDEGYSA